jgi:hypothetical protein
LDFLFRGEEFFAADILQVFVQRLDIAISDGMGNF